MPSLIHQTLSGGTGRTSALLANGLPLSVRIASGSPYSRNSRVKAGKAPSCFTDGRASQPSRKRLKLSVTVSG